MSDSLGSDANSHLLRQLLRQQVSQQQLTLRLLEKLESSVAAPPEEVRGSRGMVNDPRTSSSSSSTLGAILTNYAAFSAFIGLTAYAILTYTLGLIAPTGVTATDFGGGYVGLLERFPIVIAFIAILLSPLILLAHRKGIFFFWTIILGAVLFLPPRVPDSLRGDATRELVYEKVVSMRTDAVHALQGLPQKLAETRRLIENGHRPESIDFMGIPLLDPGISIARITWTSDPRSSSAKTIEVFGSECVMLLGQADGSAAIYGPKKGFSARLPSETAEILRTKATSIEAC